MNGSKFRLVGLSLLSGAALAVGCGGDDGGGGGNNASSTTSPVTTTIGGVVTNNVNAATSSQSTNGTSNGTNSGTSGTGTNTGTTGSGTTGSGTTGSTTDTSTGTGTTGSTTGSGGGAGAGCEDEAPTTTGSDAAGAGGEGGASGGEELTEGFNFVDEAELGQWSVTACADGAANCFDEATLNFSCGVLQVEISWPEDANTEAKRLQLQHVVSESMLYDLSGKTLHLRVRMTSASAEGHGYDFNVIAQDYIDDDDDSNDWKWFSTCYNGSGSCPDNPSGETYSTDTWVPVVLPMRADLAPDDFAFDGIRKFAIEIGTKHWADGEPFSYDAAPTTFEIDYVAW